MENNKKWAVLTLTGKSEHIEVVSSYIDDQSLGGYSYDNNQLYYFNNSQKDTINDILVKHPNKFNIKFSWGIQKEEDWHLSWKDNFTPIKVNNDLLIIPDWDNKLYNYNKIIKIKPGMAFGTGHHETTFLMLKHLINNLSKNNTVLDLGAGSGILSIVSYCYGAKKITAVEFDSDCTDNFIENMEINSIALDSIDFLLEDALCLGNFNYDIILANINKNIIKELIPKLKNSKATILLSGILNQDQEEIVSLLELNQMRLISKDQYNEWILMVVQSV